MRVLVQLRPESPIAASLATARSEAVTSVPQLLPGFQLDPAYGAVEVPVVLTPRGGAMSLEGPLAFSSEPEQAARLVRGEIPDDPSAVTNLLSRPDVSGVFGDPVIENCLVCPGSPPVGSDKDVARLLEVAKLRAEGLDGSGVSVAVLDSGINVAHLRSKGQQGKLDSSNSFTPAGVSTRPGQHPVDHGTMCAYDACIAAPAATLLDHAVLLTRTGGPTVMSGLLSDAILSFSRLLGLMRSLPPDRQKLVVNNSWGMFNPAWDFAPGHPGNFSHNPAHPFNVIVAALDTAGADILFAAGNCGHDCPDGRCAFGAAPAIVGANSHPRVLSVAGVDTTRARVGYSSQGPGTLAAQKPDISAYTHFTGSGALGNTDGGTSAACPVAAGVVAAVRTKYPASVLSPAQLRSLIFKTAVDLGLTGFDHNHGWGLIDPMALAQAVAKAVGAAPAPPWPGRHLRFPPITVGDDVRVWQQKMVERRFPLTVDGKYGAKSKQACVEFQRQRSLQADGIVGPMTWNATWTAPM